jgi:hypothetical protein
MIGEINFFGVFVPSILVLMLIAYVINTAICMALNRLGFYRLVWHRTIFDLALYTLVLGILVYCSYFIPR